MKLKTTLFPLFCLLFLVCNLSFSQTSCNFTVQLTDQFGDGWSGASVKITVGNITSLFTLDGENDNGLFKSFNLEVNDQDSIIIEYVPVGNFNLDNAYIIFNPEGIEFFKDGQEPDKGPVAGIVFRGIGECPDCLVSNPSSVSIDDVRAYTADISWNSNTIDGSTYEIEYGIRGFVPGTGLKANTGNRFIRLRDLLERTDYQFYLSAKCPGNFTSRMIGPFEFTTRWATDLGIIQILAPVTSCDIEASDSVIVVMKNFGGQPQSLIPFRFSVNGIEGGVPIPTDGFYTGVLGKDSIAEIPFETLGRFPEPNDYIVKAWTELEGDSLTTNDTTTISITKIPVISQLPYFEKFESWSGGWTIGGESRNPSWQRGNPDGSKITAISPGNLSWVTNLNGFYNSGEFSQLYSPCLDFSNLNTDPRINFQFNFNSESCCDKGWLEMSIDGETTWQKVGAAGTGFNWYNNIDENLWSGDGGFSGWVTASNVLTGAARQPEVRLRFVFSSDSNINEEGVGIDNVSITMPNAVDMAGISLSHNSEIECGSPTDQLVLNIGNLGNQTQTRFNVSYQINNQPVVTENVGNLSIAAGRNASYSFTKRFDSSLPGTYFIKAWTSVSAEGFSPNDTAYLTFSTAIMPPFGEDFERGILPQGWASDEDVVITNDHSNISFAISNNLYSGDRGFEITSPVIGPIVQGDSLNFDYRIVNNSGNGTIATSLSNNDIILVQISIDCGETYNTFYTIDISTHISSSDLRQISIPLGNFLGEFIKVRFLGTWGSGDYYVDIDNVYIPRCTGSLGLSSKVTNVSRSGKADGQIQVFTSEGVGPYSYKWEGGQTGSELINISNGMYRVTVTDRFGCSETLEVIVDIGVSTKDLDVFEYLTIYPNPSKEIAHVQFRLTEPQNVKVELVNLLNQSLYQEVVGTTTEGMVQMDIQNLPPGLYLVRLKVGENLVTVRKLIKS